MDKKETLPPPSRALSETRKYSGLQRRHWCFSHAGLPFVDSTPLVAGTGAVVVGPARRAATTDGSAPGAAPSRADATSGSVNGRQFVIAGDSVSCLRRRGCVFSFPLDHIHVKLFDFHHESDDEMKSTVFDSFLSALNLFDGSDLVR